MTSSLHGVAALWPGPLSVTSVSTAPVRAAELFGGALP